MVYVNPEKFNFELLPDFAAFVLAHKLEEYSKHSLKFAREEDLPLLKSLSKYSDEELQQIGMQSAAEFLTSLAENKIYLHIELNVQKWLENQIEYIDQFDVAAEDITLLAFIRRKTLSCFVSDYTSDHNKKKKILTELDQYTTHEQLVSTKTFIKIQQDHISKVNEDLKFQEQLLLEAQEISEMGSYFVDYLNDANSYSTAQLYKITGLSTSRKSDEFFEYIHEEDKKYVEEQWLKAFNYGGAFDYIFRYVKDGDEKWLHSKGVVVIEDGIRKNFSGTLRDVTKERHLLTRLIRSEELHKEAQQLTHLGNWTWEIGTNEIIWSDEMYRIYGLEPQSEVITFERFSSLIHPEDRETRIREIMRSLETGIFNDYIVRVINPDGAVKVLQGHGKMETDVNGNPLKVYGTCQDITREHKLNSELVLLNSSLSDKNQELTTINKELESFNYIASHDLQEPLRKIRIYAGRLLDSETSLSESGVNAVNKVLTSASRMQRLIADLIEFSQISSPSEASEVVSLNHIIDDVKVNFNEQIESGSAIISADELPVAKVIRFQFAQLLNNIIGNALKYRIEDGIAEVKITGKTVSIDDPSVSQVKKDFYKISISDNGIGFDPEQKDKIFDLFKRLHANEKYSGTGIGLAICKKIISNHHGFITAESEKGKGATFNIFLPYESIVSAKLHSNNATL
jgi:PAS domain S-box-containing protein